MFPHNITVYRNENGIWQRYYVYGVLWQDTEAVNTIKSGLKDANSLRLFIPYSSNFEPLKKDLVLRGIIDYQIQTKPSELYPLGDVRTITTVDRFDFGGLKHYEVGGK